MDLEDPSPENDEFELDDAESRDISSLRDTFRSLCYQFPDLILSLTYSDGSAELQICDETNHKYTLPISLMKESCEQVYDAIFAVKACLKRFDA
ncbi:MAG TPA: hypothetical protein PKA63_02680 [Oligoflexia bacterium]|nr:hypothetical protein [Oligoflexia bacterium]HMP47558.1 hypothetical protein [Oligoflexia bacterium]